MLLVMLLPVIMIVMIFLPLFALPLFWLLPLDQAIPLYALSVVISATMFWFMRESKRRRSVTGEEGLIGREVKVVSQSRSGNEVAYLVEVKGETWSAASADRLKVGETATITAMDGLKLIVTRKEKAKTKAG